MKNMNQNLRKFLLNHRGRRMADYREIMRRAYLDPDVQTFLKQNRNQLSKADLLRSAPQIYEYVSETRRINQGKKGLIPGYVPKLSLDDHSITVTYQPTQQTIARRQSAAMDARVHSVDMSKKVKQATLKNFYYDENQTKGIIEDRAAKFAEQYHTHPDQYHRGMYIYGSFGIGKTYLLAALANRLAKLGIQTTLVHFPTFANEMKASIQSHSTETKIDSVKKSPILMLDDVGADDTSPWIRDDVFSVILEYRMQNELSTFFSSNYSMDELAKEHLSFDKYGDQVPLKAQRIMERIHFLAKEYHMLGKNHRNPNLN